MKNHIKKILTQNFGCHVVVESNDDVHFTATVVSEKFEGLSRVARHQAVMALLQADLNSGKIHALSLKLKTPQE